MESLKCASPGATPACARSMRPATVCTLTLLQPKTLASLRAEGKTANRKDPAPLHHGAEKVIQAAAKALDHGEATWSLTPDYYAKST